MDARYEARHDGRRITPFAWDRAIGLGLDVLRLSPDTFWRMTPRELALALGALFPAAPMPLRRTELAALERRFPDTPSQP